jgi:predicted GNAT superfamily acetyltransferase
MVDLHGAGQLFSEVWKTPGGCPEISDDLLKALQLAGSYIAGAFDARSPGHLVGASVAFGSVRPVPEPPELHSHLTGAVQDRLSSGVGFALKLHQRCWALERGIGIITWTFDPLVRRNSVFNLAKLGACAAAYLRDIYGSLPDVLNAGGESDPCWPAGSSGTPPWRRLPPGTGGS